MTIAAIAFCGMFGVFARYGLDRWISHETGAFPVSTFLINILGSLLIGYVHALATQKGVLSEEQRLAVSVGFLGGFTTFSAYSLQVLQMAEAKAMAGAIAYMMMSPLLGVGAAWLGLQLGRI